MAGFIRYQMKNGVEYGSYLVAKRVDGKKINDTINLGRVIDKEKGIFQNRKQGRFTFSVETGTAYLPVVQETGIYDFGNVFVLEKVLEKYGFNDVLKTVFEDDYDTLCAMVFYRMMQGGANNRAIDWYEGSWAKSMFPNAGLHSQRLSEFFVKIGNERFSQKFFSAYLPFIKCSNAVLIDSTGLPNSMNLPITAVNNHCGQISNETRFILVNDNNTIFPVYYRYVAGNVVDISTMSTTLNELSAYGTNVNYALLDAGYSSEENIRRLYSEKINFITRLPSNRRLYKSLCRDHLSSLKTLENLVKYRDRLIYVKRVEIDLYGNAGFAYIAVDLDRYNSQFKKHMLEEIPAGEKTIDELYSETEEMGLFILISSEKLAPNEVLPLYYKRQQIEQMFDFSKNCTDILPLRTHNENTFRGHLLLSFITLIAYTFADKMLEKSTYSLLSAFSLLRNLKIKVYPNSAVVQEPTRKIKDIAELFAVPFPATL